MFNKEQIEAIKKNLISQLDKFPQEKRELIKEKILSMNDAEFETFARENFLSEEVKETEKNKCIFCGIISKEIPSFVLAEDEYSMAVLEINPLSRGHSLVIPKKHKEDETEIPESSFEMAKRITKKIKENFKPREIKITTSKMMSHSLLEIIPIYGNEKERKKATHEELEKIQKVLKIEKEVTKKEETKIPKLKARIP